MKYDKYLPSAARAHLALFSLVLVEGTDGVGQRLEDDVWYECYDDQQQHGQPRGGTRKQLKVDPVQVEVTHVTKTERKDTWKYKE